MIINAMICVSPDHNCEFCKMIRCGAFLCQKDEYCEDAIMKHIYIPNEKCEDCGKEEKKK